MSDSAVVASNILASRLKGRVVTPDDNLYQSEKNFPWSQTCWLPAACYVQPHTSDEVAIALKCIKEAESQFAIRCGGHNCNVNVSSVDSSGVVIDLRNLNSLSLDRTSGIARVGAGCKWEQVYAFLEEHGLTAIGGRQKDVGVGGFFLGGGMSAFSNLHGLGADNIVNFEVVLASSIIVNANKDENSDLCHALKGGGSNFGVVTRFDIQTCEIKAQYTLNMYDLADYSNILRATIEVQEAMETDPKYGMFVTFYPTMCFVGLFYADWAEETPKAFKSMKSLVDSLRPATHLRRQVYTASTKLSYDMYLNIHKHWLGMLEKNPGAGNMFYAIPPVSTNVSQLAEARGGNPMGIERVPQTWWAFASEWEDEVNDAAGYQGVSELCSGAQKIAQEKGQLLNLIFMNDASTSQNVLASYGADNARMLQETAAKYDPQGVFQKLQYDGFLIRKM
ncbi:6-hydroxy-D-nicotine oxidase [Annulohypoxylon maeteangense]|uniref:6-hydroxy-D-nicotine oxidase n=1 Tax=Annulohypoxylon maeteangense TaxID=1927788 RepID=UPI002007F85E|nr:6-hydroxy-D-nicotine oxidase [Annulohypoxylon maeteangense]KAI0889805.1 6-hydroxy-D-nicotine oxidase [Annulohypoxylon maeteangense]